MYESFYKLTTKPFRLIPDPLCFYPSVGHKRALSYLLYGLNQAEGFVVITGAPGTGKTTLAHKLLSQIDHQSVLVAHLTSTQIEAEDLLRMVATSFKLRSEQVSKAALLKDIESFLLARSRERKRCLLVVDEAQNLPPRSIEELRMLSNFQVGPKALLQIFLLGQEQFRTMLNSANFEQLRQRVIADFHLQPLDAEETQRYVEARLQFAHWQNDPQFDAGAYAAIFDYTRGLPRRINIFCDRLMLYGFLEGLHVFTRESVSAVVRELSQDGTTRQEKDILSPVEHNEVRSIAAGSVPFARLAQEGPPNTVETPKSLQRSTPPIPPPTNVERLRPAFSAPQPVAPTPREPVSPTITAPKPTTVDLPEFTSVFAAKTEREMRADNTSPPTPINQRRPVRFAPDLSASPPSLASSESNWLWVLLGSTAVILMLAVWFYPQLRSEFVALPEMDTTWLPRISDDGYVEPATLPSSKKSAEFGIEQPLSDTAVVPTEIVPTKPLTDGEAAVFGMTGATPAPIIAVPREGEPVAVDAATAPAAANAPLAVTPEIALPIVVPAKISDPTEPAVDVTETRVMRDKPLAKAAPVNPPPVATAPVAPKEIVVKPTPVSERELALLIRKFARFYGQSDLVSFIALFDPNVVTEDHDNVEAVRNDYSELFRKSAAQQISFSNFRWETNGEVAHGTGSFEVRVRSSYDVPYRILRGTVRMRAQKKGNRVLITELYHKSN